MKIGIPNEISDGERRVAIVPKAATQLLKDGHEVFIETGAGEKAWIFADEIIHTDSSLVCHFIIAISGLCVRPL